MADSQPDSVDFRENETESILMVGLSRVLWAAKHALRRFLVTLAREVWWQNLFPTETSEALQARAKVPQDSARLNSYTVRGLDRLGGSR